MGMGKGYCERAYDAHSSILELMRKRSGCRTHARTHARTRTRTRSTQHAARAHTDLLQRSWGIKMSKSHPHSEEFGETLIDQCFIDETLIKRFLAVLAHE